MAAAAALAFTLAAAHRVVDRVHSHTADVRAPSQPPGPAGFTAGHVHVVGVAHLPDRRIRAFVNATNLAGGHAHQRVTGLAVIQDRLLAGATRDLAATAGGEF